MVRAMTPPVLPSNTMSDWAEIETNVRNYRIFRSEPCGLIVMVSIDTLAPEVNSGTGYTKWLHVSVSRRDRLPNWEEVARVKKVFIGEERAAVHVIPKSSDHVNLHEFCLHLWSPEHG
jgi:hypothetical protein